MTTVAALSGKKFRIGHEISAEVWRTFNVTVVSSDIKLHPPEEIDCFEYMGPSMDGNALKFLSGLPYPSYFGQAEGWVGANLSEWTTYKNAYSESTSSIFMYVNKDFWDGLTVSERASLKTAASHNRLKSFSDSEYLNYKAYNSWDVTSNLAFFPKEIKDAYRSRLHELSESYKIDEISTNVINSAISHAVESKAWMNIASAVCSTGMFPSTCGAVKEQYRMNNCCGASTDKDIELSI
jgi:hypothetical protein